MSLELNLPSAAPRPVIAPINEGLWSAAANGVLAVQRCSACGRDRYPPGDGCPDCTALTWEWASLPGTGIIYTYIWVPDRARSAEADRPVHYNVAVVEMDGTAGGPVRIASNVVDAWEIGDLHIGQRVELECVPLDDVAALPCFRTAEHHPPSGGPT